MRAHTGDTIAAIGTALGPGAIAIVRLSGPDAIEVADRVFRGKRPLEDAGTHTVHRGHIVDASGLQVDEVLATVMRAPHTYTTEHMIELGCHGGSVPARRVLRVCLSAGARLARRGEFTERAFLNGRMDLAQAEAVADIVSAQTDLGLELAVGQLRGDLSNKLASLKSALLDARAHLEAMIDFPDDSDEEASRVAATRLLADALAMVRRILKGSALGVAVRDGVTVAIVGKPNVGKSSLMNALLDRDRSIVTALPGTTRDVIEETLHIEGVPLRLIDTAGWREPGDEAEEAGVERARAAAAHADVVMFVVDVSAPLDDADRLVAEDLARCRVLAVENKTDLPRVASQRVFAELLGSGGATLLKDASVSALTGEGLDRLRQLMGEFCVPEAQAAADVDLTNVRHIDALSRTSASIELAQSRLQEAAAPELAAAELADASDALGEITGETVAEDVLQHIFERFCVGK